MLIEDVSLLILIYFGGECVVENYNIMGVVKVFLDVSVWYFVMDLGVIGVCVNVIFVGLIRMVFVCGVSGFFDFILLVEERVLLKCVI